MSSSKSSQPSSATAGLSPAKACKLSAPATQKTTPSKQQVHPQKLASMSSPKSCKPSSATAGPSPAKACKLSAPASTSIEDFSSHLKTFQEDLDTKIKAVLYSMMTGDIQTAKEELEKVRRTSSASLSQSQFALKSLQAKTNVMQQKIQSLQSYNLHLHRDANDLRAKLTNMKAQTAVKDLDSSMFEEDFEELEELKVAETSCDHDVPEDTGTAEKCASVEDNDNDCKNG